MAKCILCGSKATQNQQENASRSIYNCQNCGVFVLSDVVEEEAKRNASKLAAFFTHRKLSGCNEIVLISYDKAKRDKDYLQLTVQQIILQFPGSFSDQLDLVLQNLSKLSDYAGAEIKVENLGMAPVFFLLKTNYDALSFVIKTLHKKDLVEVNYYGSSFFPCGVIVSPKGWDRILQMQVGKTGPENAMILHPGLPEDDERVEIFHRVAQKAAHECGYGVAESKAASFENKVNLELITIIKGSRLFIADLTDAPGTVYYSVGMAMALKKHVILTCHSKARKKLRLDTEQISVLGWSDEKELYLQILNAIRAHL